MTKRILSAAATLTFIASCGGQTDGGTKSTHPAAAGGATAGAGGSFGGSVGQGGAEPADVARLGIVDRSVAD